MAIRPRARKRRVVIRIKKTRLYTAIPTYEALRDSAIELEAAGCPAFAPVVAFSATQRCRQRCVQHALGVAVLRSRGFMRVCPRLIRLARQLHVPMHRGLSCA